MRKPPRGKSRAGSKGGAGSATAGGSWSLGAQDNIGN